MPTNPPFTRRRGLQSFYADPQAIAHAQQVELGKRLLRLPDSGGLSLRGPADQACRAAKTRLLPSAEGRIEHLLVTVPLFDDPSGRDVVDPWLQDHLFAIIGHLGASVRHTVVCHLHQASVVRGWFDQLQIPEESFNLVLSKYDYTVWAQDAYLALSLDEDQVALCEGVRFLRQDDVVIADDVAAQTEVQLLQSILEFQGGNFLGGSKVHLVGRDSLLSHKLSRHFQG